ncbi:MAG: hypothetical protein KDK99_17050 [Verrucomicrobiales bacterium]|nr:hypothetical protein [Verrucomicrobiales bacterium]
MVQNWHLRSRSHQCAQTGRVFEDGEEIYTSIHFDPDENAYVRRDVALDAWEAELEERTPYSFWKTRYLKPVAEERPEIAPRESAYELLQRLVEEEEAATENARYILAVMLERRKQLTETAVKDTEQGRMRFYENKKSGEVFVIRDPELHLDELESVQDEVAMQLGFGGPAAQAAKVAGVTLGTDGKVVRPEESVAKADSEADAKADVEEEVAEAEVAKESTAADLEPAVDNEAAAPAEEGEETTADSSAAEEKSEGA